MNRKDAVKLLDQHSFKEDGIYYVPKRVALVIVDCLIESDDFIQLKKENTRLKKQLANNHHIECSCSFCKPVGENNKLNCNKCKHYYTEYKFDLLFDKCKLDKCNWELKC